ncbi:universal stress protein [Haloferax sp. S1W]|uniref:universal stress protein n=1 Tax=Haloferax sp. S1W TaxID=3377110 RepID=UPI0037CA4A30
MTATQPTQTPFRVLVPLSENEESARAQARFISSLPDAPQNVEATLTHVFHGEELGLSRQLRQTQRIGTVSHVKKDLLTKGISVQVMDSSDPYPPTKSILTLADTIDADLIVLGGGMHGLLDDLLTGNVAKSVGRRTNRPIAVVPATVT